jgi:uncharacterized protein with HEPN domain
MLPEVRVSLEDALEACESVRGFIKGKSLDDYLSSDLLRSAVERQFIIIGEALAKALSRDGSIENSIENLHRIINFRHVLVHGYAVVENTTVWGIIEKDLPLLQKELLKLVRQ